MLMWDRSSTSAAVRVTLAGAGAPMTGVSLVSLTVEFGCGGDRCAFGGQVGFKLPDSRRIEIEGGDEDARGGVPILEFRIGRRSVLSPGLAFRQKIGAYLCLAGPHRHPLTVEDTKRKAVPAANGQIGGDDDDRKLRPAKLLRRRHDDSRVLACRSAAGSEKQGQKQPAQTCNSKNQ